MVAGLGTLASAPQAALAASQGTGQGSLTLSGDQISAGVGQACAIEDGAGYCWGRNADGELGIGNTTNSLVPFPVKANGALNGKILTEVSAGDEFNCALASTGTAFCWGSNAYGQLGDGGSIRSTVPIAVSTSGVLHGLTLTQISADGETACALASTGAAYCWGDNSDGQLGDGSLTTTPVPVAVSTSGALNGKTLTQITVGSDHACALDSTGAAYCWGDNAEGGLGDGTMTSSSVPVAVSTSGVLVGKTLTQITAAFGDTCALASTGAAYCWGDNANGQLGNASTTSTDVPATVNTGGVLNSKTLTQISSSDNHTCALDSTGAAYCWGSDANGQLGNASTTSTDVPVTVNTSGLLSGRTVTQISARANDTCALDSRGAIFCWGTDALGELGNDTIGWQDVPVLAGPENPTEVTASRGNDMATIFWTAPVSLDTGTLIGYTATASPGGRTCITTGATNCVISGLADGQNYSVTVVAATTVGYSGASIQVTVSPGGPRLT
jgi:alpha-tubulin suppressor-like RCC1 family protein